MYVFLSIYLACTYWQNNCWNTKFFTFYIDPNLHSSKTKLQYLLQNPRISTVRHALNLLTSSAARLQEECQDGIMGDLDPDLDLPFKTQQVMQCAFDIARAAKELVTLFQWRFTKDFLNQRSDRTVIQGTFSGAP